MFRSVLAGVLVLLVAGCFTAPVSSPVAPDALASLAKPDKKIRVGLALGGGAARGFAHIGVIKALEAQGIVPDLVVGTSAGSVVGALYASGMDGFTLHKAALEMDELAMSDWSVPLFNRSAGVLKGEALQAFVNQRVKNATLENMKIPFGAVATDVRNGEPVLFRRGNTGLAVRASSAVPGVFQAVKIGQNAYVDGGLVSPVPVRFAREMGADFVIAVNISAQPESQNAVSTLDLLLQTFAIMGQSINRFELKDADVVLQPALGAMGAANFAGRNAAVLAGEQATAAKLAEIKSKLAAARLAP